MSIMIGKAIYQLLSNNTEVKNYVGDKIYPLQIPENKENPVTLPAMVYSRSSDVEYTRDGAGLTSSGIDITVIAKNYEETIDISQAVINVLDMYEGNIAGVKIFNIKMINIIEDSNENAFFQKLTFQTKSI
jgi:hypothetical protein